jgi:nitrogenase molybdenum-iron protein alpha/beta subunit
LLPVVLDNPVEAGIVRQMETGIVARDPADFARAIRLLAKDTQIRQRLSRTATAIIRGHYSIETTARELERVYGQVLKWAAKTIDSSEILGPTPEDIFLSCLGSYAPPFHPARRRETRRAPGPGFTF